MIGTPRRLLCLGLALLLPANVGAADLVPVPPVFDQNLEPQDREQLAARRAEVEASLADGTSQDLLAERFGRLGMYYWVYDFPDAAEACWVNAANLEPQDFRWHYYLGVLYRIEGNAQRAAEALGRALLIDPESDAATVRLGRALWLQGEAEEAARAFRAVLGRDPGSAAALYGLGKIAVAEGKYDEALPLLERALELQPQGTVIHHQLGLALRGLGDLDAAREHLSANTGVEVTFSDPLVEELGSLVQGARYHFKVGVEAMRQDRYDVAVASFLKAQAIDPKDPGFAYNLGVAYRQLGRSAEAARAFEQALELDPEHRDAAFNLATTRVDLGRIEAAAEAFERVVEIDPTDDPARLEWSVALAKTGRVEEARRQLETLVERSPLFVDGRLALVTLLLQRGDREGASRRLEAGLALDHDRAEGTEMRMRLARIAEESGETQRAIGIYAEALERAPDRATVLRSRANLLGRVGRFDEAAADFEELVAQDSVDPGLRLGLAMAHVLAGRCSVAIDRLGAAIAELEATLPLEHLLARLLATCPEDGARDGERALALARQVMARSQTLEHAETLAMALAETGRFDEAVGLQRRVLEERLRVGDPTARDAERRLDAYARGLPERSPWARDGGGDAGTGGGV